MILIFILIFSCCLSQFYSGYPNILEILDKDIGLENRAQFLSRKTDKRPAALTANLRERHYSADDQI